MPAKLRWLLAIPDAIRQLEALDRDLLTRRDVEKLFGVSRARRRRWESCSPSARGRGRDERGAGAGCRPAGDRAATARPPWRCPR